MLSHCNAALFALIWFALSVLVLFLSGRSSLFSLCQPRSASNSVAVAGGGSGVEGAERQAASVAASSSLSSGSGSESALQAASDSNPFAAVDPLPVSLPAPAPAVVAASASSSDDGASSVNPFAYGSSSGADSAAAASSSALSTPAPLSDVSTATPNRLAAVVAALPSYTLDDASLGSSGAGDERQSQSKHGRIVVGEPELKGGKFTSFHVYKVSSAASTAELVWRRYSDFVWLRNLLVKSFPGIFIPPLPEKKAFGNHDSGTTPIYPSRSHSAHPKGASKAQREAAECQQRRGAD